MKALLIYHLLFSLSTLFLIFFEKILTYYFFALTTVYNMHKKTKNTIKMVFNYTHGFASLDFYKCYNISYLKHWKMQKNDFYILVSIHLMLH